MSFNPAEYVNDLVVNTETDEDYKRVMDMIKLKHLIYDDAWTVRQSCYNEAFGMLSHLKYIGGVLLPRAETRLNQLDGNGIMSESDITVGWGTHTANEDQPHVNDEISIDEKIDNQRSFIDQLTSRMRTVAISFVLHMQEHDDISRDLDQLTFSAIQARSQSKKSQAA